MISFTVLGKPEPQGSSRAFMAGGRPVITSTNKNLKDWRTIVALAAQEHAKMHEGAVRLVVTFWMPRPKSLPRKVMTMTKRPDLDKLVRAVCDALTGVMWKDDSQITYIAALKCYATAIDQVGVRITIDNDRIRDV